MFGFKRPTWILIGKITAGILLTVLVLMGISVYLDIVDSEIRLEKADKNSSLFRSLSEKLDSRK